MREYIVPVANTDKTNEGMYIGFIRTRHELIRCKDCKWFGESGCAVSIVDESDEPKEDDFCSWGVRKEHEID